MRTITSRRLGLLAAMTLLTFFCVAVPHAGAQDPNETLFKSKCAMCHGPDAAGKTKMGEMLKVPDLHSAEVQKQTEAQLLQVIAKGKNKMPAYEGKLSKEEIAKLAAYVHDLGKKH